MLPNIICSDGREPVGVAGGGEREPGGFGQPVVSQDGHTGPVADHEPRRRPVRLRRSERTQAGVVRVRVRLARGRWQGLHHLRRHGGRRGGLSSHRSRSFSALACPKAERTGQGHPPAQRWRDAVFGCALPRALISKVVHRGRSARKGLSRCEGSGLPKVELPRGPFLGPADPGGDTEQQPAREHRLAAVVT